MTSLNGLAQALKDEVLTKTKAWAFSLMRKVQRKAVAASASHKVTGALSRAIMYREGREEVKVLIDANVAPHAQFVHFPTKAHTIKPKKAGDFLVFKINGKWVKAKEVKHPGYKGDPFLFNAFNKEIEK